VWVDTQGGQSALWAYDFTRKKETTVPGSAGVGDQYALGGSLVAWIVTTNGASVIRGYDLGTDSSFTVPLPAGVAARDLAISGTTIVWSDNRNATSVTRDDNNDIYGYDIATGKDFPICQAPGMQVKPAIDGDLVAWLDARPLADGSAATANAVYGYLLTLGKEFAISTGQSVDGSVSVTGDRVIWTSHENGQATIFGATVTHTGDQIVVSPIKP
jgi:TolB protein